jgi:hypothetical protein
MALRVSDFTMQRSATTARVSNFAVQSQNEAVRVSDGTVRTYDSSMLQYIAAKPPGNFAVQPFDFAVRGKCF